MKLNNIIAILLITVTMVNLILIATFLSKLSVIQGISEKSMANAGEAAGVFLRNDVDKEPLISLNFPDDEKKTMKLDKEYSSICVIDEEDVSFSDFSADCTSARENLVVCNGSSFEGISCL